jgi:hypothetical protein
MLAVLAARSVIFMALAGVAIAQTDAQYFLGDHYQRGGIVEQNSDRAKGYFRLCAAKGDSDCQLRLARIMFGAPIRSDHEYEQALAWFQVASEHGVSEAKQIIEREKPNLNRQSAKKDRGVKTSVWRRFQLRASGLG